MSVPPNNVPGRQQALAGRNITGNVNVIAQQKDVNQAYQKKATATSAAASVTRMLPLVGKVNGTNTKFGLPVTPTNGYAIISDGATLSAPAGYVASGLSITVTTAPTHFISVQVF